MKFFIDMPLSPDLALWLSQQGHDAVHASALGLFRTPDSELLDLARRENRIVITADLDFSKLLAMAGSSGPGLILFRGGNYSDQESLDHLQRVLATIPLQDLPQSLVVIERARIRRRWLPINRSPITPDARAAIYLYETENGGRAGPTPSDQFGLPLRFEGELFDCRLLLDNIGPLRPGDRVSVPIKFLNPSMIKSRLLIGSRFQLWELRVIGEGVIEEIT